MAEIDDLRELPVAERIQLVEDLWDSIAADSADVRLSVPQTDELDRRLDRLEQSPSEGVEWATLKSRILNAF
jgi:putative addiction module component (TIGR02574 family)